jgi:amino acid adenylation domain-containing protein
MPISDELSKRQAQLSSTQRAVLEKWKKGSAAARSDAITRRAQQSSAPISYAQQRLWFLDQLLPGNPAYNISAAVRMTGTLDIHALQQSLDEIIRRHEALRTSFVVVEGQPTQVIAPAPKLAWLMLDLRQHPAAGREAEALRLAVDESQRPFELTQGPLVRAALLQLSDDDYVLVLTMHHIISDGWSIGVLIRELATCYAAFAAGKAVSLPELPIQYSDYAIWQREWLEGAVVEQQLAYWRNQLGDCPAVLELPTDRPRPAVQTFRGAIDRFVLPDDLSHGLYALSQQEGATLFMTLLAAFNILLYRYTGQSDHLVGTPIANRSQPATEGLIGFFVNTLVLRTDLSDNPTFRALLARVRRATVGAYAHQDLPFERLVAELQPDRDMSRTPLFQVMLVLQNAPLQPLQIPGLTLRLLELDPGTAKFDLQLFFREGTEGLRGSLEYSTDLFDAATIDSLIQHFQILLRGIVTSPDQRIDDLPLLSDTERQQLTVTWNATQVVYPQEVCLDTLIEDQVKRTPESVALIFDDQHITYSELNCRANQLAHYLRGLGVGPETGVGVCAERSIELVLGLLGSLKAGGAYVPLDPTYPTSRLAFMLADSQVRILLTQQRLTQQLPDHMAQIVHLDADWHTIAQECSEPPPDVVSPDRLAYVIYTSGSTGTPKGAMITHRAIINRLLWMRDTYHINAGDTVLQKTPFSFDVSVWEFFCPLLVGARLVLARPDGHRDSAYLLELIGQQQITLLHFVPSMLQVFLDEPDLTACHTLRHVFCSGEALPTSLMERFFTRLGTELHNLYGPTEAAVDVTAWACVRGERVSQVSIGRPIANVQIYLLDHTLQPVAVGMPGMLYIGGVQVGRGYLKRPDLTAATFIPDPFSDQPGQRLYRTGDLARYHVDGTIEFLGRCDEQVKLHGFRIELGEVEALLEQCPLVRKSTVLVREDVRGHKRLIAYIVVGDSKVLARDSQSNDLQSLTTHLHQELHMFMKERLPEYMIPARFIVLDALPLTPNGKIDRRALPMPDQIQPELEDTFVAPRTPVEATLAAIWASVLGVEHVSVNSNFFALGGDSINAIQIVSRSRQAGLQLTPKDMFQHQTLAAQAAIASHNRPIAAEQKPALALLSPRDRDRLDGVIGTDEPIDDVYPLTPLQSHMLTQYLSIANPKLYAVHALIPLRGIHVDVAVFEQAWQHVINHHPVLRTSFIPEGLEQPLQIVHRRVDIMMERQDWRELSPDKQEECLEHYIQAMRRRGFDISKAPQTRLALFQIDEDAYHFVWSFNYMLQDGWSLPLIIKDFFACYQALIQGQEPHLERPRPYRDYIEWLQQQDLTKAELFWRAKLKGLAEPTPLVSAFPRTHDQGDDHDQQRIALSEEATQALHRLARQQQLTLNTFLLGTWSLILSHYAHQDDIIFGTVVSGRPAILTGVEYMVGSFNNMLPVRVRVAPEDALLPWLKALQTQQVELRQYEYTPLSKIEQWNEIPPGHLKFDSYIVVESWPIDPMVRDAAPTWGRGIGRYISQTEHPLRVEIWLLERILVVMRYYQQAFSKPAITRILADFERVIVGMVSSPDQCLGDLLRLLDTA